MVDTGHAGRSKNNKTMALHFKLNPLFDSISGTISRKRFPDGHIETIVATKKGTIYVRKWYPPKPSSGGSRE